MAIGAVIPLPQHPRLRSLSSVLNNGGRQEDFLIRWPEDRLAVPVTTDRRLIADGGIVMLMGSSGPVVAAELFRVRDAAGTVVGIASRTTSVATARDGRIAEGSDWIIFLPSRGSLYLSQANGLDVMPRARAGVAGYAPAQEAPGSWGSARRRVITSGPAPDGRGRIVRGTDEFEGLTGTYEEAWEAGDAGKGATSGRIMLSTRIGAQP